MIYLYPLLAKSGKDTKSKKDYSSGKLDLNGVGKEIFNRFLVAKYLFDAKVEDFNRGYYGADKLSTMLADSGAMVDDKEKLCKTFTAKMFAKGIACRGFESQIQDSLSEAYDEEALLLNQEESLEKRLLTQLKSLLPLLVLRFKNCKDDPKTFIKLFFSDANDAATQEVLAGFRGGFREVAQNFITHIEKHWLFDGESPEKIVSDLTGQKEEKKN